MPLYDFRCKACGERFEARVSYDEPASCPACAAPEAERLLSPVAGPFTVGRLRGVAAKRADDTRRVREEQRGERRERRRGGD
jgi:putative FmdB family regulatory protein